MELALPSDGITSVQNNAATVTKPMNWKTESNKMYYEKEGEEEEILIVHSR